MRFTAFGSSSFVHSRTSPSNRWPFVPCVPDGNGRHANKRVPNAHTHIVWMVVHRGSGHRERGPSHSTQHTLRAHANTHTHTRIVSPRRKMQLHFQRTRRSSSSSSPCPPLAPAVAFGMTSSILASLPLLRSSPLTHSLTRSLAYKHIHRIVHEQKRTRTRTGARFQCIHLSHSL